jgi:hypothetical protein
MVTTTSPAAAMAGLTLERKASKLGYWAASGALSICLPAPKLRLGNAGVTNLSFLARS